MRKKGILIVSGLVIILLLTGCFDNLSLITRSDIDIWHNPDGSGRIVIKQFYTYLGSEEEREEYLESLDYSRTDILSSDSLISIFESGSYNDEDNIKDFKAEIIYDEASGEIISHDDYELANMLGFNALDGRSQSYSDLFWVIEENKNGTHRFTFTYDFDDQLYEWTYEELEEMKTVLKPLKFKLKFYTPEFIEGDSYAVYDAVNEVVVWEISFYEILTSESPLVLSAVYRLEPNERGFLGSIWLLYPFAGLLSLMALLVVAVALLVSVIIIRRRKENTDLTDF